MWVVSECSVYCMLPRSRLVNSTWLFFTLYFGFYRLKHPASHGLAVRLLSSVSFRLWFTCVIRSLRISSEPWVELIRQRYRDLSLRCCWRRDIDAWIALPAAPVRRSQCRISENNVISGQYRHLWPYLVLYNAWLERRALPKTRLTVAHPSVISYASSAWSVLS